ncbi:MAG: MFS transporter [Chloroflexota bacterium]|nr:MFS transporter [Chloroflexota bacterium]
MYPTNNFRRKQNQPWGVISLLRLGAFGFGISGFFMAMESVILPVLVMGLVPDGAKNTLLSVLGLSGLMVAALVQPIAGWYSDRTRTRLGRRVPYMIWGCLSVTLGMLGLASAVNYISLFVVWVLIQANASVGFGPFQALIRDLVPLNRLGVASSLKIFSDISGGAILIAITGLLLGKFVSGGASYWLWIALGILGISLIITASISSFIVVPRERAVQRLEPAIWEKLRATSRLNPQLGWFLLSRYLMISAAFIFPTYGLFYLKDMVQVSNPAQTLGVMIVVIGGVMLLSVYPAGWVSDRVGRKRVVVVGAVGSALGLIMMTQVFGALLILAVATFTAVFVGIMLAGSWALANELGTSGREGQHIGLVSVATISGAGTSKLLGPLVDLLNMVSTGLGYTVLMIIAGALFLLGALVLMRVKPVPI